MRKRQTFLYNTGPINNIDDETWNRPQYYNVTRVANGRKRGHRAATCRARRSTSAPAATPDYDKLASQATYRRGRRRIFAGQRADAFHVDLGWIFDLGALRPFNQPHAYPRMATWTASTRVQSYNVHTIALQVTIDELTRDGLRDRPTPSRKSTIGVWATASRRKARVFSNKNGGYEGNGPWVRSRAWATRCSTR